MAITDALGYSQVCARLVPLSLTTDHRRQRKAICSEMFGAFWRWRAGLFVPIRHGWRNLGLTIMSRRRKANQSNGIDCNHQEQKRRSSRQLLPPERSWSPSFGILMEWLRWMWWPEARQSIRTRTSDACKKWNYATGEWGLTGIHETCRFSTTMLALTQVYGPSRQIWLDCAPLFPL